MDTKKYPPLSITYRRIDELQPFIHNARTRSKHQIRQIARSIRIFGFTNPILIDGHNNTMAGHGRIEAAKLLGMKEVPTICLEDLTEDQIRAYVIADNKLAENAGWDKSILAIELQHLLTLDCFELDVTITGFEIAEVDLIIGDGVDEAARKEFIESDLNGPKVTESGDLWLLGKHRILCGNSQQEESFRILMDHREAAMVFTDPPFNVKIDGHATGNGTIRHREFSMASGEMTEAQYLSFLNNSLELLVRFGAKNSVHYICIDWRNVSDLIAVGKQHYEDLLNMCVWVKDNGGMGSFYRSQHELVVVFRKGPGPHRNNIQLGKFGRNRTNIWRYPGVQTFSKQGDEGNLLALHPTVKPVALVADAILDCSARNEVVLDPFLGSGTTLMAAERVGRICYGIEIDSAYVDVAIRRWQKSTGEAAIHAQTGKRFDEIAAQEEVPHV